jgi:hypothetical protein
MLLEANQAEAEGVPTPPSERVKMEDADAFSTGKL